jgi:hypothetical protein
MAKKAEKPDLDKIFSKYSINQHVSFRDLKEVLNSLINGDDDKDDDETQD